MVDFKIRKTNKEKMSAPSMSAGLHGAVHYTEWSLLTWEVTAGYKNSLRAACLLA